MKAASLLIIVALVLLTFPLSISAASIAQGDSPSPEAPDAVPPNPRLEYYASLRGDIGAVALTGNYAVINVGSRISILNVADKTHPILVGQTEALSWAVKDIVISGDYAYVAAGTGGVHVINIANKSAPVRAGSLAPTGSTPDWSAEALTVAGNYLYVAASKYGLRLVDVSTPSNPVEVNNYNVGGSYYALDVAVNGGYVYLAYSYYSTPTTEGLYVLRHTLPSTLTYVTTYAEGANDIRQVAIGTYSDKSYAYLGIYNPSTASWYLRVVDITTPASPLGRGKSANTYEIYDIYASGNQVFLAETGSTSEGGFFIKFVITNFDADPIYSVSGYKAKSGVAVGIAASGAYMFGATLANLEIIDPAVSVWDPVGAFGSTWGTWAVLANQEWAYVGNGIQGMAFVDISNPAQPVLKNFIQTYFLGTPHHPETILYQFPSIYSVGNYFHIIDVSNPNAPRLRGNRGGNLNDAVVAWPYLWAIGEDLLAPANVSNPDEPVWMQGCYFGMSSWASGLALQGNIAYAADATYGLRLVDITNPCLMKQLGRYNPNPATQYFTDVVVDGERAYASDWYGHQLHLVNVASPSTPVSIGSYAGLDHPNDLELGRNEWLGTNKRYIYVADDLQGVRWLDVTTPASIRQLGHWVGSGSVEAEDVSVQGNYVYVATHGMDLVVLRQVQDVVTSTLTVSGGNRTLFSSLRDSSITFPDGAFDATVNVVYRHLWTDQDTGIRAGIGRTIQLSAVYASTGQPATLQPGVQVTAVFTYTNTGAAIENTLRLYGWDGSARQWSSSDITSSINTSLNRVTAQLSHLSLFAVLGDARRLYLPLVMR